MLRAFAVVGLMLLLLVAAVFGPQLLRSDGTDDAVGAGDGAPCDLLTQACRWSGKGGPWSAQLQVLGEDNPSGDYQLSISAPGQPEGLVAVLRGESMYMGEYPVPLEPQGDGRYLARFDAPVCSTGADMRWRVDLQQGSQPTGGAPAKLVFQAHDL